MRTSLNLNGSSGHYPSNMASLRRVMPRFDPEAGSGCNPKTPEPEAGFGGFRLCRVFGVFRVQAVGV